PSVLLAELDAQRLRPCRILLVESLEGVAISLAIADVLVLVDGRPVPDQRELLALERDVEGLPLAGGPGEVLGRIGPLVQGATIMEAQLGLAEAVEDLDLEESTVVDPRVAPLGHVEFEVELVIGELLDRHEVRAAAIIAAEQGGRRSPTLADGDQPGR